MLVVSVRLFARSFSISSAMLSSESSPRKRSSSIFASSSAIGCSKSRNCSGMRFSIKGSFRPVAVHQPDTVAAHQLAELVEQLAGRLHRPFLAERQRPARLVTDVVHCDAALATAPRPQRL